MVGTGYSKSAEDLSPSRNRSIGGYQRRAISHESRPGWLKIDISQLVSFWCSLRTGEKDRGAGGGE